MVQMLPFDRLITIDKSGDTAVYLQIANSIMHHIRMGVLRRGGQLPGSRELAEQLGVNRNTIKAALDELTAQGWIEALPRKGIFVASDLPEIRPGRALGVRGPAKRGGAEVGGRLPGRGTEGE